MSVRGASARTAAEDTLLDRVRPALLDLPFKWDDTGTVLHAWVPRSRAKGAYNKMNRIVGQILSDCEVNPSDDDIVEDEQGSTQFHCGDDVLVVYTEYDYEIDKFGFSVFMH